jgi:hypothetical protein
MFSTGNLIAGFLFSMIGLIGFRVGRARGSVQQMLIGAALLVYPYVVENLWALWLIGVGLTALLFLFKDDGY